MSATGTMSAPEPPPVRRSSFAAELLGLWRPRSGQTPGLFAASSTILSIAAVYCYFAGYVFCYYYYYRGFGVTLESLDLSPQFFFIRAYTALYPGGLPVLLILGLVIAAYLGGKVRAGIMVAVLAGAFPLLSYTSKVKAQKEQTLNFCSPENFAQFQFRDDVNPTAAGATSAAAVKPQTDPGEPLADVPTTVPELEAMSRALDLALVIETKDRIVVSRLPKGCSPFVPKDEVYTLLRSDLKFVHLTVP